MKYKLGIVLFFILQICIIRTIGMNLMKREKRFQADEDMNAENAKFQEGDYQNLDGGLFIIYFNF